jgi:hypothetical protein
MFAQLGILVDLIMIFNLSSSTSNNVTCIVFTCHPIAVIFLHEISNNVLAELLMENLHVCSMRHLFLLGAQAGPAIIIINTT